MRKQKIFLFVFSLLCAVHIFQVEKVEAKMLLRKELEPTGYVTWEVPNNEKIIAITFDDGPDPTYTPQVLHLLRQYKAEATFFMIGFRVQRNPYLVKQVLKEGHEIGNHTMNHLYANSSSDEKLKKRYFGWKEIFRKMGERTVAIPSSWWIY